MRVEEFDQRYFQEKYERWDLYQKFGNFIRNNFNTLHATIIFKYRENKM